MCKDSFISWTSSKYFKNKYQVASRIITPALIPWKNSFAVLVESKPTFLKIASPSEGFLTIELNNIEKVFEDGIDVLLEKTNLTQEKNLVLVGFCLS